MNFSPWSPVSFNFQSPYLYSPTVNEGEHLQIPGTPWVRPLGHAHGSFSSTASDTSGISQGQSPSNDGVRWVSPKQSLLPLTYVSSHRLPYQASLRI